MTTLRDATLDLERGVNDVLGDEITYAFADGTAATFNAWVEFDSEQARGGSSTASTDALLVEVPADRVALPEAADRITIAMLPGKVYAQAGRYRGAGGASWRLPLKRLAP